MASWWGLCITEREADHETLILDGFWGVNRDWLHGWNVLFGKWRIWVTTIKQKNMDNGKINLARTTSL